jgi:chromosome segregation ATPase
MVDIFPIVASIGTGITVIWGIVEVRKSVKSGRENAENRIISAIDTRLDSIKVKISDNEKSFITHVTEKEKLMIQLKEDIHKLEGHLQELCNTVSKHQGILESVNPTIIAVQNQITSLKEKVNIMEGRMKD